MTWPRPIGWWIRKAFCASCVLRSRPRQPAGHQPVPLRVHADVAPLVERDRREDARPSTIAWISPSGPARQPVFAIEGHAQHRAGRVLRPFPLGLDRLLEVERDRAGASASWPPCRACRDGSTSGRPPRSSVRVSSRPTFSRAAQREASASVTSVPPARDPVLQPPQSSRRRSAVVARTAARRRRSRRRSTRASDATRTADTGWPKRRSST